MATNEKILTRRERVNAILDTLGDLAERDFSLFFSYGQAECQLFDGGLSALAAAHGAKISKERTNYGTANRSAVIDGVKYEETELLPRKPLTCPVCGETCGRVFRSERGAAVGCDVCLTEVSEYGGAESAGESPDETPQA